MVIYGIGSGHVDLLQQLVHVLQSDLYYVIEVFIHTDDPMITYETLITGIEEPEELEEAEEIIMEFYNWAFFKALRRHQDKVVVSAEITDAPWRVKVVLENNF